MVVMWLTGFAVAAEGDCSRWERDDTLLQVCRAVDPATRTDAKAIMSTWGPERWSALRVADLMQLPEDAVPIALERAGADAEHLALDVVARSESGRHLDTLSYAALHGMAVPVGDVLRHLDALPNGSWTFQNLEEVLKLCVSFDSPRAIEWTRARLRDGGDADAKRKRDLVLDSLGYLRSPDGRPLFPDRTRPVSPALWSAVENDVVDMFVAADVRDPTGLDRAVASRDLSDESVARLRAVVAPTPKGMVAATAIGRNTTLPDPRVLDRIGEVLRSPEPWTALEAIQAFGPRAAPLVPVLASLFEASLISSSDSGGARQIQTAETLAVLGPAGTAAIADRYDQDCKTSASPGGVSLDDREVDACYSLVRALSYAPADDPRALAVVTDARQSPVWRIKRVGDGVAQKKAR